MRIGHRISEDLDLVTAEKRLPRAALEALVMILERAGFAVIRNDDEAAYEEFLIAGDSLHNYQQDFLIDGVKVGLLAAPVHWTGALDFSREPIARVATLHELFRLEAIAASERRRSRDGIDLYYLFKEHGFTLADFHQAFQSSGIHYPDRALANAFQNLCLSVKSPVDPGYEMLIDGAPSLPELAKFFAALRDQYQIDQARLTFQERKHMGDAPE